MAQNTLLTIGMITREALPVLENECTFTRLITTEYDPQFAKTGAKIGSVLNVRLPVRFTQTQGQGLILQDLTESSIPVVLNTQYQRSFSVTSADLTLNIDDFRKRFIRPAMISMANQIDYDGLGLFTTIYNEVGTPGTVPTTIDTYLSAQTLLDNEAAPMGERNLCINPLMNQKIVSALAGLLNPQTKIGDQYKKGMMGKDTLGFDWYMDQNVRNFTVGPLGGTPVISSTANQTGSSITTSGWTSAAASRLNVGDVFTIGAGATGVYAVNPQNGQSTGVLRNFVVTAPVSSDGSGNATIPISPAIVVSGAFKTVTGQTGDITGPATSATINVNGAANTQSARGLAFTKTAFTFASADLPLYGGLDRADRIADDQDMKLSIRVIQDYDINTDRCPLRMDLLGGWSTLYAQEAVRIAS